MSRYIGKRHSWIISWHSPTMRPTPPVIPTVVASTPIATVVAKPYTYGADNLTDNDSQLYQSSYRALPAAAKKQRRKSR